MLDAGTQMVRRLLRDAAVVLGAALAAVLAAAVVAGWRAAAVEHYWQGGYPRLGTAAVWERFDVWGAVAVAAALALVAGLAFARWRGWRTPFPGPVVTRAGLTLLLLTVAFRVAGAVDLLRVGRGRPNVLLISIDTLRADRLGAYGYEAPTSPAIDRRLAAAGVVFTDLYSQSPKTTPSHMTMLTSLYPSVHGVWMWDDAGRGQALNPAVMTLAEVLKDAGYATAAFTAGGNVHRARGFGQGFDVYRHGHELERARRWLAGTHVRPFFLFFHTYAVHDPYLPPAEWAARFTPADYHGPVRAAVDELRPGVKGGWAEVHRRFWASVDTSNAADVRFISGLYDGLVGLMDRTIVTPLLDDLEARGLADSTLVVLTSDHGEAFGEHENFLHEDLYRETLHVPFILRLPRRLPAGRRVDTRARLLDLTPTVLDLAGLPAPADAQGRSLVPLIADATAGPPLTAVSEAYQPGDTQRFQSLRRDGLTYIVQGEHERLFDLATDPGEHADVAAARPDAAAALRSELDHWRDTCQPLAVVLGPRGAGPAPDAETLRQLRALGYVE